MGLLLICPHCQAKIALILRTCPACGGNLQNLPPPERRYYVYRAPAAAAPTVPSAVSEPYRQAVGITGSDSSPEPMGLQVSLRDNKDVSLCEALDRILHKGAVLFGEVIVSVADIDLIYLGLQVILASMETARGLPAGWRAGPNLLGKGA